MPNQYVIKSAQRTLEVLLAFTHAPHRFGLADLQQVTRFEKNQLYRSLKTLEAAGFLAADGDGRYQVTDLARSLALTDPKRAAGGRGPRGRGRAANEPRYERRKTVAAD